TTSRVRGAGTDARPASPRGRALDAIRRHRWRPTGVVGDLERVGAASSPDVLLAFAAGLLSGVSPLVLPLLPPPLSLISGISVEEMQEGGARADVRARVMRACVGFVLGFSAVFVVLGAGAVAAGQVLRTWRTSVFGVEFGLSEIAGFGIVVMGLHMTGL